MFDLSIYNIHFMECNGCSTLSKPFSNNLPYCKNCLFLYFCHQMLRLCVQNGREFSIKKGNQNNLFCLNTKKNMCVAQLCNILICHTTPECLPIFRHTISPCTTRWFTGARWDFVSVYKGQCVTKRLHKYMCTTT